MASLRSINSTPSETPEFVNKNIIDIYKCPVTGDILRDCVQLPCGHKVSGPSVDDLFLNDSEEGICPINDEDCFPFGRHEVLPDYGTRREILKLKVYCTFKNFGCTEQLEWIKLENHCSTCIYRLEDCPKKSDGCEDRIPHNELQNHVNNICQYSTVTCQFCGNAVPRKDMQEHHSHICQGIEVRCKYDCDIAPLPRHQMLEHEASCVKRPTKCPYASAGCQFEGKEMDVRKHEKDSIVEHMALNQKYTKDMEKQNSEIQKEIEILRSEKVNWETKIHDLKTNYDGLIRQFEGFKKDHNEFQVRVISTIEKVFSLEELMRQVPTKRVTEDLGKELRELKDKQDEMGRKLDSLNIDGAPSFSSTGSRTESSTVESLKKQIQTLERQTAIQDIRLAELDLRFQILETASYDGVLIWKIMDYSRRKQDAMTGRTYSLFSQPFYTGRFGYKMCGRVYLNGDGMGKGTHMSLFFVVMKGEHDALMPWPFSQTIHMALIDQENGSQQVTDSFRPDTSSSSFQRPSTEMNTAVGCPLFASHQKLETTKYLKDDTIFIKIVVDKAGLPHH